MGMVASGDGVASELEGAYRGTLGWAADGREGAAQSRGRRQVRI